MPSTLLAPPTDESVPNDHSLVEVKDNVDHPAALIPRLCELFYKLGWCTGTGGGISVRDGYVLEYIVPSFVTWLSRNGARSNLTR